MRRTRLRRALFRSIRRIVLYASPSLLELEPPFPFRLKPVWSQMMMMTAITMLRCIVAVLRSQVGIAMQFSEAR
ncbi:hypothetical protein KC337_g20 [Hortaea werneckii]|nr:hypothetical protein KC337_g20 [Hortaea werneckii]